MAAAQSDPGSPWTSVGGTIATSIVTNNGQPFNWGVPPFSGRIDAIAINGSDPSDIYVGTAGGGVWKSTDGGSTWGPVTESEPISSVSSITITSDGRTIYVGTGDVNYPNSIGYPGIGILKSTDGGRSWTILGGDTFQGLTVSSIVVNPADSSQMLASTTVGGCCQSAIQVASTSASGIYLSQDGGATWALSLQVAVGVADLTVVEDTSTAPTSFVPVAGDFAGVVWSFFSPGYGNGASETDWSRASWVQYLYELDPKCANNPGNNCRVATASTPANQGVVYAIYGNSTGQIFAVLESTLSTSTHPYTVLNNPQPAVDQTGGTQPPCGIGQSGYDLFIAVDPANPKLLYVACTTLYRSTDGGATWQPLGGYVAGSLLHPDFHAFAFSPTSSNIVYVGNDGGIWVSSTQGTGWTNLNSGLATLQFYSIALSPTGQLIGGTQDNGCEAYAKPGGWYDTATGDGNWVGVAPDNSNIWYCIADGQMDVSTDGGNTYNAAENGVDPSCTGDFHPAVAQDPNNPGTVYWGTFGCFYKTTDHAQSWTLSLQDTSTITAAAVAPSNSNLVYFGDANGFIYQSQNGGFSWSVLFQVSTGGVGDQITSIVVNPSVQYDIIVSAANYQQATIIEENGGSVSSFPTTGLPPSSVNVLKLFGTNFYAGTDDGGVYYLPESGGTSWSAVASGLKSAPVTDLAMANGLLYAATWGRGTYFSCLDCVPLTLSYGVTGGSGYTPPSFTYTLGGNEVNGTLSQTPTLYYLDPGSSWNVNPLLNGSTSTYRWETPQSTNGTADLAASVSLEYYQQFNLGFDLTVVGGGTPPYPTLGTQLFSQQVTSPVSFGTTTLWVDAGSAWSVTGVLNGTSGERWTASQSSGTASQGVGASVTYTHQYYAQVAVAQGSGEVPSSTGWYDAGSQLHLSATPSSGWAFHAWEGSGSSAYSGNLSSSTVTVGSPLDEGAVFYPGVTLAATGSGSLTYSYGGSSGTVPAGGSQVFYVPLGTTLVLSSNPSSFLYQFNGWSGLTSASGGSTTVNVSGPVHIQAEFGVNYTSIFAIIGGVVAVIALLGFVLLRRRPPGSIPQPS